MTDFATRRRMMVDTQVRPSDVTEFPIIDAMLTLPREAFVPTDLTEAAYADSHVPLGDGRVVLEPRLFAKMLDALNLTNADLVLHVGAGLGYGPAIIARIAEAVVAVEDDESRTAEAQTALNENNADNVILHCGDLGAGAAEHGPYDAILIEGGIETLPDTVSEQLKDGGRIVAIFMDGALGRVMLGTKSAGRITWRFAFNGTAPVLQDFQKTTEFVL